MSCTEVLLSSMQVYVPAVDSLASLTIKVDRLVVGFVLMSNLRSTTTWPELIFLARLPPTGLKCQDIDLGSEEEEQANGVFTVPANTALFSGNGFTI